MLIKKINPLRERIIAKLLGLSYRLDNSGNAVFVQNGETDFTHQLKAFFPEGFTIFDVGANKGEYTELMVGGRPTQALDEAHLFEPQKSCFEQLQQKFNNKKKIYLNNFGLSDKIETATIYKDTDMSGLSSLYQRNLDFYNLKMEQKEKIELSTAQAYIEENNIKKINLLKIDVEGHELKVLAGFGPYLNSDFIDFIQFEYGGANLDAHTNLLDFYKLLEPLDFIICKIKRGYLEERPYNPRLDNFVNQNFVAISKKILPKIKSV